jgi:hypothetical protein
MPQALSTTGPGTAIDLGQIRRGFRLSWTSTGSPATVGVNLEGSTDNSTWVVLGSSGWPNPAQASPAPFGSATPSGAVITPSGGVRFLRPNVIALSGGSSPTVNVWLGPLGSGDQN